MQSDGGGRAGGWGRQQARRLNLEGFSVSPGNFSDHELACPEGQVLASTSNPRGSSRQSISCPIDRRKQQRNLSSSPASPWVFPNPPGNPSSSLVHRSTLPALLPSELALILSRKLPLTPNSYSSFNVIVSSHSARPDGLHSPLHLSHSSHNITCSRSQRFVCLRLTHLWTPRPALHCHTLGSLLVWKEGRNSSKYQSDTGLPRNPQPVPGCETLAICLFPNLFLSSLLDFLSPFLPSVLGWP